MQLSPELLSQIQQAIKDGTLNLGNPTGRSPIRPRQLHDLRLLPTKDDPRPTFFWSAEAPRDGRDLTRTEPYPRLMWHVDSGQEITVISAEQHQAKAAEGYVTMAPAWVEPDPMEAIKAQWDALSPDDQALLLESQKQDRIAMLKAKLSALPEAKLAELLSKASSPLFETPDADAQVKRGPGRPRKESVA